jgi:hypothetical protein
VRLVQELVAAARDATGEGMPELARLVDVAAEILEEITPPAGVCSDDSPAEAAE